MSGSRTGKQVKPAIRDSHVFPKGLTDPSQEMQRCTGGQNPQRPTKLPHGGSSTVTSGRINSKKGK